MGSSSPAEDHISELSSTLWNEAITNHRCFEFDNRPALLDHAVTSYRRLLNLSTTTTVSPDAPEQYVILGAIGDALTRFYKHVGGSDNIDNAIAALREALFHSINGDATSRVPLLIDLAEALCISYESRGGPERLDEAILLSRDAVQLCLETDSLLYCAALQKLSRVLLSSYITRAGSPEQLDECLQLSRQGLQFCTDSCTHFTHALNHQGIVLQHQYSFSRTQNVIEEAEGLLDYVLHSRLLGSPERHVTLASLARLSRSRHQVTGNIIHLERARFMGKDALSLCPAESPFRDGCMQRCGIYAMDQWRKTHVAEDLYEAISFLRASLCLRPPGHPSRWFALNNLGQALQYSNAIKFNIDVLNESLQLQREALSICNPRQEHGSLIEFASALYQHYWFSGDLTVLEDIIHCYRKSLELAEPSNVYYRQRFGLLANSIQERYRRLRNATDLEEGVTLYHAALTDAKFDVSRAENLAGLAQMLIYRYQCATSPSDLDEAIALSHEASLISNFGQFSRPFVFNVLGDAYVSRFGITLAGQDADAARVAYTDALNEPQIVYRGYSLLKRAYINLRQNRVLSDSALEDILGGLENSQTAISDKLEACQLVLQAICELGLRYFRDAPMIANRVIYIFSAINHLFQASDHMIVGLHSRLENLALLEQVATHVIVYGSACGQLGKSLEIFEESHSLFWAQALRLRTPMDMLPTGLREDMIALSRELENISFSSPELLSSRLDSYASGDHRRQADKLNSLIDQARSLPGFSHFMLRDDIEALAEAARDGPIVMLICSALSCDALILLPSREITTVAIPTVTREWLAELNNDWSSSVKRARSDARERLSMAYRRSRARDNRLDKQSNILRELWKNVVLPVLAALGMKNSKVKNRPRLWWCCTGEFAFLPIHAAGDNHECCTDYVVSSYIPNIGALLKARQGFTPPSRKDTRVLLGAVTESNLAMTTTEIRDICNVIPPGTRIPLPAEEDPLHPDFDEGVTTNTLMQHVETANILHLACHGMQDSKDPLNSGFILKDGKLTVADLMRVPLPRAFFAFMSACETAKGDAKFSNQNIHLAAAMLFAGFKSVIGTMWSMDDVDGPIVARMVYERLFEGEAEYLDPARIPYALDEAVQMLRRNGVPPGRWATYIHLGV